MPPQTQDAILTASDEKMPEWLKPQIFEDLLKKQILNFKSIRSLKTSAGVTAGENYATVMLRVQLEVETTDPSQCVTKSFMLKTPHQTEMYRQLLEKSNVFDIERGMYHQVVFEMEELYRQVGLEVKFGAEAYEISATDNYVLLEDLRPRGFCNADRLKGLDLKHTECVLARLAQWHAASAVRVANRGPYEAKYTKGFFDDPEILNSLCEKNIKSFLNYIELYKGHEAYLKELPSMNEKLVKVVTEMNTPQEDDFVALNHGDSWSNNIMFQYNEKNEILNTYFVDFQIPKWGTVAQDLLYFLLSSTRLDIKISKFEYFIWFYHKELINHLKLLKYTKSLPSLKGIHRSLYKYGGWGFFCILNIMGIVLLDPTEEASFENFFEEDTNKSSLKKLIYTNPRYIQHMEVLMPWLLQRGALE